MAVDNTIDFRRRDPEWWDDSWGEDGSLCDVPNTVEVPALERKYTSTLAKLVRQHDRFPEWERGILRPISLQVAPTDKCNLKCSFCSVANRAGDELGLDEILEAVDKLIALGLKTVEITGGGEPTMYSELPYLIALIHERELGIGLITNGVKLTAKLDQRYIDMLDWLRISLNSLDYVDDIEIPTPLRTMKRTTLGFSYVVNARSKAETVAQILEKVEEHDVPYLRVVPDCLTVGSIRESKHIAQQLGLLQNPKAFWQEKIYNVPARCRMGYLKPYLNADGYFYHCSANPLIERRFHPGFRMGAIDEIDRIWSGPAQAFSTDLCQEGKCFFKEHNDFLDLFSIQIEHRDFV